MGVYSAYSQAETSFLEFAPKEQKAYQQAKNRGWDQNSLNLFGLF